MSTNVTPDRPAGVSEFALRIWDLLNGYAGRAGRPGDFIVVGRQEQVERVQRALEALHFDAHVILDEGFSRGGILVGHTDDMPAWARVSAGLGSFEPYGDIGGES